jgi:hypothetical protein
VKTLFHIGPWLLFAVLGPSIARAEKPSQEAQVGLVKAYLEARTATMQAGARPADVERVLSLCSASMVYEHPRVGIRISGIESLRSGMLGFLGLSRNASITITASLQGLDVVAVRTAVAFEAQKDATWEPVKRSQAWVFEFEGSKIKRIIEYW